MELLFYGIKVKSTDKYTKIDKYEKRKTQIINTYTVIL